MTKHLKDASDDKDVKAVGVASPVSGPVAPGAVSFPTNFTPLRGLEEVRDTQSYLVAGLPDPFKSQDGAVTASAGRATSEQSGQSITISANQKTKI